MPSAGRNIQVFTNTENGKNHESKEVDWTPEKSIVNMTERNEAHSRLFGGRPAEEYEVC